MTPTLAESLFSGLEPRSVWSHFATLCAVPRPSKGEGPLRDRLLDWALARGLAAKVDAAGNLLIRKPARCGLEGAPGVALQAHLDMVCQKNAGTLHDFSRDPIRPVLRDGWIVADETTLGADNGTGVALILALLEDDSAVHGPVEALLTVDEEAGMGGARGLVAGELQSPLLLNLDTEDWGEFYLGCAGGLDVDVDRPGCADPLPEGFSCWRLEVGGLRGGHSGVDIHEGRGNAIKLLVRVLRELEGGFPLRLASVHGGTARNALPREAVAVFALPAASADALAAAVAGWQEPLRAELREVDPGVRLSLAPDATDSVLSRADQSVWLSLLHAAPHGVRDWSDAFPGVVETSNNLGIVDLSPERGRCNFMVRSLVDSGSLELGEEIAGLFAAAGVGAEKSGNYPGWATNPDSRLLALCKSVYRREFGGEAQVKVIHAGLECGIIGAKHPGIDIVSFGPNIRGAHAPGERVEVESVANAWRLLKAIVAEVAGGAGKR